VGRWRYGKLVATGTPLARPADPLDDTVAELQRAFQSLGYEEADNPDLETGFEKLALFGVSGSYTHAARQLSTGKWTSKLGNEDIEHDLPATVAGGVYGEVVLIMKRRIAVHVS
jgi:hypothetical protein